MWTWQYLNYSEEHHTMYSTIGECFKRGRYWRWPKCNATSSSSIFFALRSQNSATTIIIHNIHLRSYSEKQSGGGTSSIVPVTVISNFLIISDSDWWSHGGYSSRSPIAFYRHFIVISENHEQFNEEHCLRLYQVVELKQLSPADFHPTLWLNRQKKACFKRASQENNNWTRQKYVKTYWKYIKKI